MAPSALPAELAVVDDSVYIKCTCTDIFDL